MTIRSSRALRLEVIVNPSGDKTPADIAKVLRQIADHLADDFTDVDENGELRQGVGHFIYDLEREDPSYDDGSALGIGCWDVVK